MQVKPPKQIWIGRGKDRQLSITTITGEEAQPRAPPRSRCPPPCSRPRARRPRRSGTGASRRPPRVPGMYPPRIYKPQLYPPDVQFGPGGIQVRMPQMRGPQVARPADGQHERALDAGRAEAAGRPEDARRAAAAPERRAARSCPRRACSASGRGSRGGRCSCWRCCCVLLFLLYRSLPQNVVVPKLVGHGVRVRGRAAAHRDRQKGAGQ